MSRHPLIAVAAAVASIALNGIALPVAIAQYPEVFENNIWILPVALFVSLILFLPVLIDYVGHPLFDLIYERCHKERFHMDWLVVVGVGAVFGGLLLSVGYTLFLRHKTHLQGRSAPANIPEAQQLPSSPSVILAAPVTLREIADFASGRTLAISPGTDDKGMLLSIVGTAFWVHEKGFAATCRETVSKAGFRPPDNPQFIIAQAIPPQVFAPIAMGGGTVNYPGYVRAAEGTIAIIVAPAVGRGIAASVGPNRTPVRPTDFPFPLSSDLPEVGQRVFLYGVEQGVLPTFTPFEGKILRLGASERGRITAYSDLPFRNTYCGAPVMNEVKEIIGMVLGRTSDGDTELIVAKEISDLMRKAIP